MFKKLFDRIMEAKSPEEIEIVLCSEVDIMFQREKITWADHERLFTLGGRLSKLCELLTK